MTRLTRRRVSAVGAAAMVLAATLAGCGGGSDSGSQAAKAAGGAPQRGGELVYLDAEIPISAQVQESGYWQDRALLQNVLDRLLYRNPETHEIEPWIAESWKVSKDGTTYDFVIREGVSYSDGQPLDVESVKRNLEWQIDGDEPNGITPNPVFPKQATITTDPATRTVSVELPEPYAPFLAVLTTWSAGLVADATIEKSRDEQARFSNLIGSGAFVVTTEQYGKKYVLSARKEYEWAPPSWENQGAAYVDQVTIIPVQEDAVRLGTLKSGQAHLLRYVQPSEERALAEQGYEVVAASGVGLSNQWFIRQDAAPYLKDERVRKALLVGIDRETIVKDLYSDSWSAATSVLSPGTVGYKDQSAKLAYDPDAANQLLDEAGWTERNADGFRIKDGRQLDVLTYVDVFDNTAPALFQSIQVQLKELGVNLIIKQTDYSTYSAKAWANPKVAALRTGWPDPDGAIDLFNQYGPGADEFRLKGTDKQLDELLAKPLTAKTKAEEEQALAEVQDYIVDKAYAIPVINDSQVYVAGPKLHGLTLTDGGLPEYHNAWLEG